MTKGYEERRARWFTGRYATFARQHTEAAIRARANGDETTACYELDSAQRMVEWSNGRRAYADRLSAYRISRKLT